MKPALLPALPPTASPQATTARGHGRNHVPADPETRGSPFSELMGKGTEHSPPASSAAAKDAKDAKDSRVIHDERPSDIAHDRIADDRDGDDDAKARNDQPPGLPVWLQALRAPPPAEPATPPSTALPAENQGADPAVAAAAATSATVDPALLSPAPVALPASTVPAPASDTPAADGLLAGDARTPSSSRPGLLAVGNAVARARVPDAARPVAGFAAALSAPLAASAADPALTAATPELPLPPGDTALSEAQSAALGSALDQLSTRSELPPSLLAAAGLERNAAAVTPTVASTAVDSSASLLAAGQSPALDAFGEPLALDAPDAAIRMAERLRWLTEAGVQEARMQLHPKELGAIDVRIRVEQQTASVWFGADHPAARAALEATLPQLRERLAADGLQLGQTQVGSQAQSQGQGLGQGTQGEAQDGAPAWGQRINARGDERDRALPAGDHPADTASRHRGLVDRYA